MSQAMEQHLRSLEGKSLTQEFIHSHHSSCTRTTERYPQKQWLRKCPDLFLNKVPTAGPQNTEIKCN